MEKNLESGVVWRIEINGIKNICTKLTSLISVQKYRKKYYSDWC